MGNWLKALVAAACICVIAVSGHYGYSVYARHRAEVERLEALAAQVKRDAEATKARLVREEEAQKREQAERRKARYEDWKARRDARRADKERIEREKQADRENAAKILKDAVVE